MNNILSKYVFRVRKRNNTILFNTINESIVLIKNKQIKENAIVKLKNSELKYLQKNNFFNKHDNKLTEQLLKERGKEKETLIIILSLTQLCKLKDGVQY